MYREDGTKVRWWERPPGVSWLNFIVVWIALIGMLGSILGLLAALAFAIVMAVLSGMGVDVWTPSG